jgi:ketosteroid isomerase-like protein
MKTYKTIYLAVILSLISGVANSEQLDKADVEKLDALWSNSYTDDSTGKLMTLYSDDAIMFPPSSEILEGKSDISAYLESMKSVGVKEYSISNVDLNVQGNTAYSTELWEATRVDASGNSIVLEGNITNVFEKQENGSWKIKYQSWN